MVLTPSTCLLLVHVTCMSLTLLMFLSLAILTSLLFLCHTHSLNPKPRTLNPLPGQPQLPLLSPPCVPPPIRRPSLFPCLHRRCPSVRIYRALQRLKSPPSLPPLSLPPSPLSASLVFSQIDGEHYERIYTNLKKIFYGQ
jgi:hypothetical protein